MKFSQIIVSTHWYDFLKILVRDGRYQWQTPDKEGNPKIVSTLYIDGDLHCSILEPEGVVPENFSMDTVLLHINKITTDLTSLQRFTRQITVVITTLTLAAIWTFDIEAFIRNTVFTVAIPTVIFILRKWILRGVVSTLFFILKRKLNFSNMFK